MITPRLLMLVALVAALMPACLQAQESPKLTLPEQADVRIIVDISGSMKENDPDNLRQPAVRLLARMLPEGATAGLWTFGQYVNMLVPHREVSDAWRATAIEQSAKINSVALRTNLGKAIDVAGDGYYTGGVLENTHFILLTDGKVDLSDDAGVNRQEERRILETIVPELVRQGATFHPVALSSAADAEFLKELAKQSGGRFQIADTAEALNRVFLEALNTAVPQEQIPIEGNAFTVDSGVSEFTALVFWGEQETRATRTLELVRPDGTAMTLANPPKNVRWARDAGYDLMTVSEPIAGEWRINGELGEGSRVTVVSDLRMAVSPIPATFSEEQPIELSVAFFEDGEKITNEDFLQVLEVRLQITSEDGRSGSKVLSGTQPPVDGVYTDTIGRLPEPGLYRIDVTADGQTFGRKFTASTGFVLPEGVSDEAGVNDAARAAPMPEQPAEEQAVDIPAQMPDDGVAPAAEVDAGSDDVAEPDLASPIDVSAVEEPQVAEPEGREDNKAEPQGGEEENASALPVPVWMLGAGAGGLGLLALIWLAMRQRRARTAAQAEASASRETLADLEESQEAEQIPVAENESVEAADEAPSEIPEVTEAAEAEDDMSELEAVIDELPDDDIPVADTVVEPETGDAEDEMTSGPDGAGEEPSPESEEDEEFGLDDFDLSEFEDLPDYEEADSGLPDEAPAQDTDDQEQKK